MELLDLVAPAIRASTIPSESEWAALPAQLIARAIPLAAFFDRSDLIPGFIDMLFKLLQSQPPERRFEAANAMVPACLACLKKIELRELLDQFVRRLNTEVFNGESLAQHQSQFSARADMWNCVLRSHLHLAAGWLALDAADRAAPILDAARGELLSSSRPPHPKADAELAQTYLVSLGFGQVESMVERVLDQFRHLDPARIRNSFSTAPFFSHYHLKLVETIVLALAGDASRFGRESRRWLDEDELLIRRRIHADIRKLVT